MVYDEPAGNVFQLFHQVLAQAAQYFATMGSVVITGDQFGFHAYV